MKKLVILATTFALSFGLMGSMVRADSDGDQDRSNTRRVARHQRVERERLQRHHHRKERRRAKESDINRRRLANHQAKERKRLQAHQDQERRRLNQ